MDEDTLGFEALSEVGIGGNFLGEEHTVQYMRTSWWKNDLFPRQAFPEGMRPESAAKRAEARARALIDAHACAEPVISDDLCRELDAIVDAAVRAQENA